MDRVSRTSGLHRRGRDVQEILGAGRGHSKTPGVRFAPVWALTPNTGTDPKRGMVNSRLSFGSPTFFPDTPISDPGTMNPTPFQLLTPFSPSHHHIIVAIHHQRVPGAQVHKFFPPVTDLGVQQKDTQLGRWGQGGGVGESGKFEPLRTLLCPTGRVELSEGGHHDQ